MGISQQGGEADFANATSSSLNPETTPANR